MIGYDMVGQDAAKEKITLAYQGAAARHKRYPSVLLTGNAGWGKTTLARSIAEFVGGEFVMVLGGDIAHPSQLTRPLLPAIADDDEDGDQGAKVVLFIDEIHRAASGALEALYPIIEDGICLVSTGSGEHAKNFEFKMPNALIIGATTDPQRLPKPLAQRMVGVELMPYQLEQIAAIVRRACGNLSEDQAELVAGRSRLNPRIALGICERIKDYTAVHGKLNLDEVFRIAGVAQHGLTPQDVAVLQIMRDRFEMQPVGLESLSSALGIDRALLTNVIEPWLVSSGLIVRTPRGRMLTQTGLGAING